LYEFYEDKLIEACGFKVIVPLKIKMKNQHEVILDDGIQITDVTRLGYRDSALPTSRAVISFLSPVLVLIAYLSLLVGQHCASLSTRTLHTINGRTVNYTTR